MNLKNVLSVFAIAGALTLGMASCNSKLSDADLKSKVEKAITSTPTVTVAAKEGVVTLNGVVTSEQAKSSLESAVKAIDPKHITTVVNNIIVQTNSDIVVNAIDSDLGVRLGQIIKDYPKIQASVNEGLITVRGEIEQNRLVGLKQALDGLNPQRVDMSAVVTK